MGTLFKYQFFLPQNRRRTSGFNSFGGRKTMIFMDFPPWIKRLTLRAKEKQSTDGNDEQRQNDGKRTVGQKEGYEDTQPKGEDGTPDQFFGGYDFHKLPPLLSSLLLYICLRRESMNKKSAPYGALSNYFVFGVGRARRTRSTETAFPVASSIEKITASAKKSPSAGAKRVGSPTR